MYLFLISPFYTETIFMKRSSVIAIVLFLFGCNEHSEPGAGATRTPDSTIYLAGNVRGGRYWRNEIDTVLNEANSSLSSMVVDGQSVIIGGWIGDQNTIWRNSIDLSITEGRPGVVLVASNNKKIFGVWNQPIDQGHGWIL